MNTCAVGSTRGSKSGAIELGTLSQSELTDVLEKHREWLKTDGKGGERANLSNLYLVGLDFRGSDLRRAILRNSDLSGVNLACADLNQADLREAQLTGADLSDADLTNVKSLTEPQLSRTDLSNAKLPQHLATFDGLERVSEVTTDAKVVLVATLSACVFSLLTITSTSHVDLIKNTMSLKVPTVDISVDIGRFFLVVPPVLLALYIYFHLTLQSLWCYAASLPEVFQDGLRLNRKARPWLLNVIFEKWRPTTQPQKGVYSRLGFLLSILLAWFMVPMTLLFFWLQFLVQHDLIGSVWLTLIVALTVFFGADSFLRAKGILKCEDLDQRTNEESSRLKGCVHNWKQRFLKPIISTAAVVFVLLGLMWPTIYGNPEWLDKNILPPPNDRENSGKISAGEAKRKDNWPDVIFGRVVGWVDKRFFADLRGMEVSVKGEGWKEYEERSRKIEKNDQSDNSADKDRETALTYKPPPVKPALLNRQNLRGANAAGAFLVKAELRDADLRKARFYSPENKTNMEEAILTNAQMQGADLRNCRLCRAHLDDANLEKADLSYADLAEANLKGTDLTAVKAEQTIFEKASFDKTTIFEKTNLKDANLKNVDISEADFTEVKEFTQEQLNTTCCDNKTKLPWGLNPGICRKNKSDKKCERSSRSKPNTP